MKDKRWLLLIGIVLMLVTFAVGIRTIQSTIAQNSFYIATPIPTQKCQGNVPKTHKIGVLQSENNEYKLAGTMTNSGGLCYTGKMVDYVIKDVNSSIQKSAPMVQIEGTNSVIIYVDLGQ